MMQAEVKALFARHGLRCTKQRETLFSALASSKSHPTAEELFEQVRCELPGISLATVYNTLHALANCGLCRRIPGGTGGGCRFDADTRDHVHICYPDGRMIDAPVDVSERIVGSIPRSLLQALEREFGFELASVSVQVEAKAPECGCERDGD